MTTLASPLPAEDGSERLARKRPRLADSQSSSQSDLKIAPSTNAVHDEDYYFADGSCIIRVEDTLFNVHRSILSRDFSSFSTLFTLSQDQKSERSADDNPVVLSGDTVSEFRNFLWSMYAMPLELKYLFDVRIDVPRLLDVAKIANKYAFKSLETWACDTILECVKRKPTMFNESKPELLVQLTYVTRLAQLCQHSALLNWSISIMQRSLKTSPACLVLALALADELTPPVPALTGAAYFAALLRGPAFWDAPTTCLSATQRLRILSGHYAITHAHASRWVNAPVFAHSSVCANWKVANCELNWELLWKGLAVSENVVKLDPVNISGRLRVIMGAIGKSREKKEKLAMYLDCEEEARKCLAASIEAFHVDLADYFPPI
ncbi:hypothetical protein DFH11DRAFT_1733518 [Phellopilus nigrolimitatus]|nr:hypothetical protein DFH11DRAFT_1733518 [Phellopilus nigrolimitatus]